MSSFFITSLNCKKHNWEDSDDIDIEEDNSIIRPTKPSHVDYRKSKIKGRHIEVLTRFDYIDKLNGSHYGAMT
jgi:hypothetical protein